MKPGPRHAQLHRVGSWQSMQATGCVTSLRASAYGIWFIFSKPLIRSPLPGLLVRHVDRGVAVDAGARLLGDLLALGEGLVVEHVGVAALLAEILGERVAGPHRLQARVFFRSSTARRPSAGRLWSACAASASLPP